MIYIYRYTFAIFFIFSCMAASAINIPFDEKGSIMLNSGVNIDFPSNSMSHCVTGIEKWDSTGATETNTNIKLVTSYKDLAKSLNVDLSYSLRAQAKINLTSLSVDTTFSKKFDSFRKNEERTLALVISANAKYGRKMLHNIKLKSEYTSLIEEKKYAEFRKQCGTHFVSGENRQSQLDLVILISGLNSHTKSTLENNFKANLSGSSLGNQVNLSTKSKYVDFMAAGERQGNMSIEYFSRGGSGLDNAIFSQQISVDTFNDLTKIVADISKSFTKENSAPSKYILVPYDIFGIPPEKYDQSRYDKISIAFNKLTKVNSDIEKLKSYKNNHNEIYSKIFIKKNKFLGEKREELINFLNDCNLEYQCDNYNPENVKYNIFFLEDILSDYEFTMDCHYRRYPGVDVLNTTSLNLKGKTELIKYLQHDNINGGKVINIVNVYRVNSENSIKEDITNNFSGFSASECRNKRGYDNCISRIFGTIDSFSDLADGRVAISGENNIDIKNSEFLKLKKEIQNFSYIISFFLNDGTHYDVNIGYPAIENNCPVHKIL